MYATAAVYDVGCMHGSLMFFISVILGRFYAVQTCSSMHHGSLLLFCG